MSDDKHLEISRTGIFRLERYRKQLKKPPKKYSATNESLAIPYGTLSQLTYYNMTRTSELFRS
ncbi:MAG: hypothetical protein ACJAZP_004029 [Psychromonas sp.]|jgi:hypothetical protein